MNGRVAGMMLVTVAGLSGTACGQVINYDFHLDGLQEVPPNPSRGTGHAVVTLDTTTHRLSWNVTFSGLTTPVTAAHFHAPAPRGVNAGVVVGIATGGATSPIVGSAIISTTIEGHILAGNAYINIHTQTFPGGEIRGQVELPPCPCACEFDTSTGPNVCDIFDFLGFQNGFDNADPCACDMDTSTGMGVCDIFDFLAFQNEFDNGCP